MSGIDVSGRLAGKVAVVTGAGQTPGSTIGNGKACAMLFARAGASVICVDRELERADATVAAIREEGGDALALAANVAKADEAENIARLALETHGRIDALVNNVGIGAGDAPAKHLTEEAFDRIMAVNFKSAWLVTKACLPIMETQGAGAIVNISSLASIAGHHMMAYETSKAAMNRMTEAVALSSARKGVRCNAILPGLIDTPMAIEGISERRGISPEALREERSAMVPMGHMGTGWDTAHAALFLVSEEANFVSGVLLRVDGGQGARRG
ncbi:SDR family NAD(P)-dependent oxidoreductase [Henriciella mobilis]|uniref:SDR family NAD(P)-dependent oxidoreductase n=1 Tax=Henriciella mobilis TaxID=2305467 RepID=UPI001F41A5B2|nr:SDR family NAD(P)-dependent oxidoreductase [Henriciella mobilis]